MSAVPAPDLFLPLALPNGAVVPNRLCKAAMEENMADEGQVPGPTLVRLYERWARGGAGLILTGNVMIDARALTGPGGLVLEDDHAVGQFQAWAQAARSGGAQVWMQINHPGRQLAVAMGQEAVAPSAVPVDLGRFSKMFAQPRALTAAEIAEVVERFANTAALAERAGFTGVQIHAAHGYLVSQFLSPLTNRRSDQWGGSLENRARLLLDIVRAVRARVSPGFCVSVKLNSADFQRGGFEAADAAQVVEWLNGMAVDLVELSGGSYESPAMQGAPQHGSTGAREAYFIDFARDIAAIAAMPIMVTGGVRRRSVAQEALSTQGNLAGVAMLGLARAMAFEPDLPNKWRNGTDLDVVLPEVGWRNKSLGGLAVMAIAKAQLHRLGRGRAPSTRLSPLLTLIGDQWRTRKRAARYRAWMQARA
jgi:2,4-dienoyl-CoA reductase-like NADH-dependent reductase (Old Yellow Enzyme family)